MNARCFISRVVAQSIALGLASFCFAAEPEFPMALSADRQTYEVGETPKMHVRIHNHSSSEVYLVRSLDGSDAGLRFPRCRLEILDAEGNPVGRPFVFCDVTNGIGIVDFVKVPPGGALDPWSKGFFPPYQLYRFPVEAPGIIPCVSITRHPPKTFRITWVTNGANVQPKKSSAYSPKFPNSISKATTSYSPSLPSDVS